MLQSCFADFKLTVYGFEHSVYSTYLNHATINAVLNLAISTVALPFSFSSTMMKCTEHHER